MTVTTRSASATNNMAGNKRKYIEILDSDSDDESWTSDTTWMENKIDELQAEVDVLTRLLKREQLKNEKLEDEIADLQDDLIHKQNTNAKICTEFQEYRNDAASAFAWLIILDIILVVVFGIGIAGYITYL